MNHWKRGRQASSETIEPEAGRQIPWAALEELRPEWVRRAIRRGVAREDAEDLFQEAQLAALEGIHRLRLPGAGNAQDAFLAWFWGILRHKLISDLRRRQRHRRHLEDRRQEAASRGPDWQSATRVRSTLGLLEQSSPEAARVLRRRYLEGRDLSEMAQDLGVSVPTACRRVQAALAEIRGRAELILR
jgi:RNA polymerase sigma factor (sigma-70 family)